MRWLVEVTSLGRTEKDSLYVDADTWQKALQVARTLRGETEPMSGFSIELLDEGCRAVDPATRISYDVQRADDGHAAAPRPSAPPPRPSPAEAPPAPSLTPAPAARGGGCLRESQRRPPSLPHVQPPAPPAAVQPPAPEAPPRPRSQFPPRPQISASATMMLGAPPAAAPAPIDGARALDSRAPRPDTDHRSVPPSRARCATGVAVADRVQARARRDRGAAADVPRVRLRRSPGVDRDGGGDARAIAARARARVARAHGRRASS